jgi:putative transposase
VQGIPRRAAGRDQLFERVEDGVGWVERSETHHLDAPMTDYRRNFVPGGTYFFTVNLANRRSRVLTEQIAPLRAAFAYVRDRRPFSIEATVILPDHLHAIWTLPDGDHDFATRWRLIKSAFSRALPDREFVSASRVSKGERGIWQRRYWEHTLRDENDFARHADYIHFNPVKHGYVGGAADWPHSTFHRMVRSGVYPEDWGGDNRTDSGNFGER